MKKKKALTPTQKERRAVRAAMRRAEKMGIRFSDKLKENISKANYSKLKSYHRYGFKRLYAEGTAISDSGEIISGLRKKNQLRIEAARKGAATRRTRMLVAPVLEPPTEAETQAEAARQQRQKQIEEDPQKKAAIQEGKIIYEHILEIIESFSHLGAGRTGEYVKEVLDKEINQYGFDLVMESISQMPTEFVEDAQKLIFYSHDDSNLSSAYYALVTLIETAIPSQDESRFMEDLNFSNSNFEVF